MQPTMPGWGECVSLLYCIDSWGGTGEKSLKETGAAVAAAGGNGESLEVAAGLHK